MESIPESVEAGAIVRSQHRTGIRNAKPKLRRNSSDRTRKGTGDELAVNQNSRPYEASLAAGKRNRPGPDAVVSSA